jgi:3'(2'), 5'-bisphosphate nucleotidase
VALNITLSTVEQVGDIAKRAGAEIMKIYETDFAVDAKADASPVTEADRVSEDLIVEALRGEITSDFPIVAEEAFAADVVPDISGVAAFWLVDGLDGTKEFVKRNGEFTVNIALIEAGRPVIGVVHAPAVNATYWGSAYGTFAETDGGAAPQVSCRPRPSGGLVAAVSRSHRGDELDGFISQHDVVKEIDAGSALKFGLVATGRADVYPRLGRTMEWDIAAGHAVVRFAGGRVADLEGVDISYGKPGFENPSFVAWGAEADAGFD